MKYFSEMQKRITVFEKMLKIFLEANYCKIIFIFVFFEGLKC